jgi:hypothetical protein
LVLLAVFATPSVPFFELKIRMEARPIRVRPVCASFSPTTAVLDKCSALFLPFYRRPAVQNGEKKGM